MGFDPAVRLTRDHVLAMHLHVCPQKALGPLGSQPDLPDPAPGAAGLQLRTPGKSPEAAAPRSYREGSGLAALPGAPPPGLRRSTYTRFLGFAQLGVTGLTTTPDPLLSAKARGKGHCLNGSSLKPHVSAETTQVSPTSPSVSSR